MTWFHFVAGFLKALRQPTPLWLSVPAVMVKTLATQRARATCMHTVSRTSCSQMTRYDIHDMTLYRYNEIKHAQASNKPIFLIRMIPWESQFDHLQARVLFGQNRMATLWLQGMPMLESVVETIERDFRRAIDEP